MPAIKFMSNIHNPENTGPSSELIYPVAMEYPIVGRFTVKSEPAFQTHMQKDENIQSGHNKMRRISAPNESMTEVHERFVRALRRRGGLSRHATGAIPGASPLKNVKRHCESRYFYQLDISSAYQQVDMERLAQILSSVADLAEPETEHLLEFLRTFCEDTEMGGLYTGSPSSPDLFNYYMLPVDDAMAELAQLHGLVYTRYLDDITLSSPDSGNPEQDRIGKHKRSLARQILQDYGMPISHHKSRNDDLNVGSVIITGIQLNPDGKMQLPTRTQRYLKQRLEEMDEQVSSGRQLSELQIAQLSGMHGMIRSALDMSRVFRTQPERAILDLYSEILRKNRILNPR